MSVMFSVIIPTLNEEKFLPLLLGDLKAQLRQNFEVIIVDAGSSDNTNAVANKFNSTLLVNFVGTNRKNLSYQRNLGAKKAKGDYLIFIDADFRVNPDFLSLLEKEVQKNKPLILMPQLAPDERSVIDNMIFRLSNSIIEYSQFFKKPFATGGCLIFQSGYFKFIGGFKVTKTQDKKMLFPEDRELFSRTRGSGVIARQLEAPVVTFSLRRVREEGRLMVLRKYLSSHIELVTQGKVNLPRVQYEMGGQHYKTEKQKKSFENELRVYYVSLKKYIDRLLQPLS